MKDNVKKTDHGDIKINLKQEHEVQYWTKKWGITSLQLETAIKAAKTNIVKKGKQFINAQCELWNADKTRMIARGYSNLFKTAIKKI